MRKRKNIPPEPCPPASHLPGEKFPSAAARASFASSLPALLGSLLLLIATTCPAQVLISLVPLTRVSPLSGPKMYAAYCAACHGDKGKGDGPAALGLSISPGDLTTIAKSNHGKFPTMRVYYAIYDGVPNPKNPRMYEMPAWRPLFHSICVVPPNCRAEIQMRVANLTSYIQSLQEK
jgi:mono/diheme cytochrome c family protein